MPQPNRVIPFPQRPPTPEEQQALDDAGVGRYVGSAHYYQPAPPPPAPVAAPRALAVELPTVITLTVAVALATALLTYQSPSQQANRQQQQQIQQLSLQLETLEAQKQGLERQASNQGTWINTVKASVCQ